MSSGSSAWRAATQTTETNGHFLSPSMSWGRHDDWEQRARRGVCGLAPQNFRVPQASSSCLAHAGDDSRHQAASSIAYLHATHWRMSFAKTRMLTTTDHMHHISLDGFRVLVDQTPPLVPHSGAPSELYEYAGIDPDGSFQLSRVREVLNRKVQDSFANVGGTARSHCHALRTDLIREHVVLERALELNRPGFRGGHLV